MSKTSLENLLQAAQERGLVSAAHFQTLPDDFPFHVAVSAIDLPEGCVPPDNPSQRRVAVGKNEDEDQAAFLALMEAVERYSIQYGNDLPETFRSFRSFGASKLSEQVTKLTIAHPKTSGQVRSIGTAAGGSLEDASRRAVLELLEHHHVDNELVSDGGWERIDASTLPALTELTGWLDGQLRRLDCRCLWREPGYAVVTCACTDFDGARRIFGYSAKPSLSAALHNAALEAVFHWRNMVALEFNGRPATGFSGMDLELFEIYRGARRLEPWPEAEAEPFEEKGPSELNIEDLATAWINISGKALHLFDMTHPKIGIPVVRALPGKLDKA